MNNSKNKFHYAWLICVSCTLVMFCNVGLASSAISVYYPHLSAASGLTNTQTTFFFTLRSIFGLAAMLIARKIIDKVGLRISLIAATIIAAAFFLFSLADNYMVYCIAASMAGFSYGMGGLIPTSMMLNRWFHSRKGVALGISAAGSGAAIMLAPPVITMIIETISLQAAFFVEAVFILGVTVFNFLVLRESPEAAGKKPLGENNQAAKASAGLQENFIRLDKTAMIVMVFAIVLLGAVSSPASSYISLLYSTAGFNSITVSYFLALSGTVVTIFKFLFGRITDSIGVYKTNFIFFPLLIAGCLLCSLAWTGNTVLAVVSVIVISTGLPFMTVGITVLAADIAKGEKYGSVIRAFEVSNVCGAMIFSTIPGVIADYTGSYTQSYLLMSAIVLISMIMIQTIYKKRLLNAA